MTTAAFNSAALVLPSPVLVTGGAGFIGSHLVEALVSLGSEVRVLDNLSSGSLANLSSVSSKIDFYVGDILDAALVEKLSRGARCVFHLAALSSIPMSRSAPQACLSVNGQGTLNVMGAAAKLGAKKLVYSSSSAVYGDLEAPHAETMAPRPNTPYAAVKLLGEHMGLFYRGSSSLATVSLRYFNVYGPRQSADGADAGVVPVFVKALAEGRAPVIYGDGRQTRDFIHVKDVVRANLLAAAAPDVGDGVFNVATGVEASVLEVLEALSQGKEGAPKPLFEPPRPGDPCRSRGSAAKAADILGFKAQIALAEGLKSLSQ
ncbi:MAG: NAD-dependent epimerase/dehydratase family protein [Deltaproteobacteria bacterium]|nr:NAD-dependent epimerase/dehydratase family protein [Deltaproteobacteria bacterium]